MCGITGFWAPANFSDEESALSAVEQMSTQLVHRGPDADGHWVDIEAGIGLGHRRLSIIDLSPNGVQPMVSASGRTIISYNGEVYNFAEIKEQLPGDIAWRSESDTEVVLEAIECWGAEEAAIRFNGMFAIAVWDRHEKTLTLIRDRIGIKPLYFGSCENGFLFGSELKALSKYPGFENAINPAAIESVLAIGYVRSPLSIYKNIRKLPPGHLLTVTHPGQIPESQPFWTLRDAVVRGIEHPFDGDLADATDSLDSLLHSAVASRMISDVPLGAFLSGGIDSSLVVAIMQSQASRPMNTFSIGFEDPRYNEAPHARKIADHLGTDHTELIVTAKMAQDLLPEMPVIYDEPFADQSQIPTVIVSRLAREKVTVSLSGDGGDELFGGYGRYVTAMRRWRRLRTCPVFLRRWLSSAPARATVRQPVAYGLRQIGMARAEQFVRVYDYFAAPTLPEFYETAIRIDASPFLNGNQFCRSASAHMMSDVASQISVDDEISQMSFVDSLTYLPDDILVKVDRASMSVALEARVPILDHRVVEFAWRLRTGAHRLSPEGRTKWVLQNTLERYVPRSYFDRPKQGFAIPVGDWLRSGVRDWAESLLSEDNLKTSIFFHVGSVRKVWKEHLNGTGKWDMRLWRILCCLGWLRNYRG